jgi:transposase
LPDQTKAGDNWAVIATLIENCKLSGINPHDWLTRSLVALAKRPPNHAPR